MLPRVLVVHNRYRSALPSGENQAVDGQIALLRGAGVEVEASLRSSDEIDDFSSLERLELAVRPIFSRDGVKTVDDAIARFRPDVVHLHNVYPLISPAVVTLAKSRGCRVVQTIHNFRHICASGSLFRDGATCTDCLGKTIPWPAVRHGCYRESRAQSVVMGTAIAYHRKTWRQVDRFLAVSKFVADLLATTGIPTEQICVMPNSVPDPGPATALGRGVLFVGRLDDQKGLGLLLGAWQRSGLGHDTELTLVGDGPERHTVQRGAQQLRGVRYVGSATSDEVLRLMRASRTVVVPPIGYEALPTVVLEALACGRPIVATRVGPLESLVPSDAGWLAQPEQESLAVALRQSYEDPNASAMGRRARELYLSLYAPSTVVAQLIDVYRGALASSPRAAPALGASVP